EFGRSSDGPPDRLGTLLGRSNGSAPADEPDEKEHYRDHQQDVDEIADRVAAHEAEQPQHEQNHRDRKEHCFLLTEEEHETCPLERPVRLGRIRIAPLFMCRPLHKPGGQPDPLSRVTVTSTRATGSSRATNTTSGFSIPV